MRDVRQAGVVTATGRRAVPASRAARRRAPNAPLPWSSGGSTARSGRRRPGVAGSPPASRAGLLRPGAGAAAFAASGDPGRRRRRVPGPRQRRPPSAVLPLRRCRASATSASTSASSKSRSSVRGCRGVGQASCVGLGRRSARRCGARDRVGRGAAACSLGALDGPNLAPARPRPADAVLVGRPVDGPGRRDAILVGRSQLERVEAVRGPVRALARPRLDRIGGGVEQLVEPLASRSDGTCSARGRRCCDRDRRSPRAVG